VLQTLSVNEGAAILLVDDDVELLKALTKVLEKEGYSVVPAPDANSAVRHINSTKQRFDLVITDVSMPGMSGTALLAAFKTAFPKTPVIIITAFADWGQYMNALRDGAYEYLYKPIEKAELLATIQRALANGQCPAALA
jgi:DNA-binding NtrC family response regulator